MEQANLNAINDGILTDEYLQQVIVPSTLLIGMVRSSGGSGLPDIQVTSSEVLQPYHGPAGRSLDSKTMQTHSEDFVLFVPLAISESARTKPSLMCDEQLCLSFPLAPTRDLLRRTIQSSHIRHHEKNALSQCVDQMDALDLAHATVALLAKATSNIFDVWAVMRPCMALLNNTRPTAEDFEQRCASGAGGGGN